ncbi:hypothetical protein XI07_18785 [Bradyrhizobium sp. CCBAU 11445]|uniref:hypothetical protein n=1 Tax=unclassified Bradyrhizobium TaxID=2631580 RepID=UPI002305463B|nr:MULTISPECIES: hypothetical protein [unclassified Bradyrhizobium]MDA9453721.1 hypothetical protein [Bradyrhizobium sp. CCBAU 21359]MDA9484024.1 hypothetical protein [Bradyrhizobium sp. CCBAU 11445]MDA9522377.1 hypothetical protein [Bradyrhizobium sp. CCBAU 11434]
MRQLEEQNGYISATLLDQNGVTPSAYYFTKRFGSLTNGRTLADLPPRTASDVMKASLKRKEEGRAIIGRQPRLQGHRARPWYRSEDILVGLKRLAEQKGRVSARLIDEDSDLPSCGTVVRHFGSLTAAYELISLVRLAGKPVRFGLPPKAKQSWLCPRLTRRAAKQPFAAVNPDLWLKKLVTVPRKPLKSLEARKLPTSSHTNDKSRV